MRRILTFAAALLMGLILAAPAHADVPGDAAKIPTINVSGAAFYAATNHTSACAVQDANGNETLPPTNAVIYAQEHVARTGFHLLMAGTYHLLINDGYPGQVLIANSANRNGYHANENHAFVPGYGGRSCTQWVQLVTLDS